jgi:hypothetical protein
VPCLFTWTTWQVVDSSSSIDSSLGSPASGNVAGTFQNTVKPFLKELTARIAQQAGVWQLYAVAGTNRSSSRAHSRSQAAWHPQSVQPWTIRLALETEVFMACACTGRQLCQRAACGPWWLVLAQSCLANSINGEPNYWIGVLSLLCVLLLIRHV